MIEKLIAEEEEKIKSIVREIKDLKNKIDELEKNKNDLESQILDSSDRMMRLNEQLALARYHNKKQFNFFQKYFFKRKEYKQYLQDEAEFQQSKERDMDEYKELESKREKLKREKSNIESRISVLQSQIGMYNTEEIREKYDQLMTSDSQKQVEYLINCNPGLAENFEFMSEAIIINPRNIQYDKTDNEELYKSFFKERMRQISNNPKIDNDDKEYLLEQYQKSLEELENPKEVEKGKYKIPHKYFFESIRDFERQFDAECKHGCVNGCGLLGYNSKVGKMCYEFTTQYLNYDGVYDEEYGNQIQNLYEKEDSYLAIHGSNIGNSELMKRIMENGLENSTEKGSLCNLRRTAVYGRNLHFFDAFLYRQHQFCAIILVPKEGIEKTNMPIKIWGNDIKDSLEHYLLPQYVYGYMEPATNGHRRIIMNTHLNDKHYMNTYYDKALEFEEREEEELKELHV